MGLQTDFIEVEQTRSGTIVSLQPEAAGKRK